MNFPALNGLPLSHPGWGESPIFFPEGRREGAQQGIRRLQGKDPEYSPPVRKLRGESTPE